MTEPWFQDLNMFGAIFGSVVGGGGGTLVGLLGAAAGALAPKGIGKPYILGGFYLTIIVGIVLLAVGVYALVVGQPGIIVYSFGMSGLLFSVLGGCLTPLVKLRYRQAEERRIEAGGIRGT